MRPTLVLVNKSFQFQVGNRKPAFRWCLRESVGGEEVVEASGGGGGSGRGRRGYFLLSGLKALTSCWPQMTFSPLYQYCEIAYVTGMCGMYCQSSLESQAMLLSQFGYLAFEPWHQLVTDHVHSSLCSIESGSWVIYFW